MVTISSFATSENNNNTNQTIENNGRSPNKLYENIQQGSSQTGKATQGIASDGGFKMSEGAKDIGKNITDVAKKLAETIDKKLQDLTNN